MRLGWRSSVLVLAACACLAGALAAPAAAQERPVRGQLLYVPAYSEIHYGDRQRSFNLAATLSVRNVDRTRSIVVRRVDYHNAAGRLVRPYLASPQVLAPLASAVFVVAESDKSGGVNPSFLVEWTGEAPLAPPLVETVMVGTMSGQGISFVLHPRVLEERP